MKREPLPDLDCSEPPGTTRRLLHEILGRLESIERKLDRPIPREVSVDPTLTTLVREIHAYLGTACAFSAAELVSEADPVLREALGELDAPGLGRVLAKLENHVIDGLRVKRAGRDANGVIWSIVSEI